MTQYNNPTLRGLPAILSTDGSPVAIDNSGYVTLGVGTYFFSLGSEGADVPSATALLDVHAVWDANLRGTLTIEFSNMPATRGGNGTGGVDVKDWDATAGNFVPCGTSDGHVTAVTATATAMSVGTITGAGGARWTFPDMGARRGRLKAIVTTQGTLRVLPRGKVAD